jgi:peptidoglycan/xylan/chitin deacetylase (PgdA/CDA1 family)
VVVHRLGFVTALVGGLLFFGAGQDVPQSTPSEGGGEQRAVARLVARGLPVFCGGGRANEVALTFDDGPTVYTPRLLAALRRSSQPGSKAGVQATFFLIGSNAARYPSFAGAERARGAVGSHTQTHATLTRLSPDAARREIAAGKRLVERALGETVQLFRPVGGRRTAATDRMVAEQGLLTVMYAVDPRDWARSSAESIAAAVLSDSRLVPGAIVLLHEFHLQTIDAVPAIVRGLTRRDLRLVSVPELLADDPPTVAEQREDARAGSCAHLYRRPLALRRQTP